MRSLPPLTVLRRCFELQPDGVLIWKVRPEIRAALNARYAGQPAGTHHNDGYLVIGLDKVLYPAHRIVFKLFYGRDPGQLEIDHINGDRADNRPVNLRLATRQQNNSHRTVHNSNSQLRVRGVTKRKRGYVAQLKINSSVRYLGIYSTILEAAKVAAAARAEAFGEFRGTV